MQFAGKIKHKIEIVAATLTILIAYGTVAHAHIEVSPSSVNFGSQSVGSSAARTVTITNNNKGSMTISSVSDLVAQFSYSGPSLPLKLNHGQSLTGSVTFKPSASKSYSGTLVFTRANGSTISISLSGTGTGQTPASTGIAPTISSQPASMKITEGQTASFHVAATGTAPLKFQWKKNGTAISGATMATYTTPAETTA